MKKKSLYVDMDGVLAEWRSDKTVDDTYQTGYFEELKPYNNVVAAIKEIKSMYPEISVNILSSVLPDNSHAIEEKRRWLKRHLPEIGNENIYFVNCGRGKSVVCPGMSENDVLLDDYNVNLDDWNEHGGKAVKIHNGINSPVSSSYQVINKDNHPEAIVVDILDALGYLPLVPKEVAVSAA